MRAELELITASAPIHATSADIDKQQTTVNGRQRKIKDRRD